MLIIIAVTIIIPFPTITHANSQTAQIRDLSIQPNNNPTGNIFGPNETNPATDWGSKSHGDIGLLPSHGITMTSEHENNQFQRAIETEQSTKNNTKLLSEVNVPKIKKAQGISMNGQYIVVFKDGTPLSSVASLISKSKSNGAEITHIYTKILKGFALKVPNVKFLDVISKLSDVSYIEPDLKVHKFSQSIPTGINRIDGDLSQAVSGDGQGSTDADIAVLDTGIDLTHPDLNVFKQISFVDGVTSAQDGDGHGTHVAGIAAAKDNMIGVVGVAPGARLWAVKVLDDNGGGSISSVIDGIEYVTKHADEIDVANISFGCSCHSDALDTAIHNSVAAGITYVVSAGNDGADASGTSPANHPDVISVSAIVDTDGRCGGLGPSSSYGKDDYFASFSNYGPKVDMAAPGVSIYSTWKGGSYAYATGTSMSAPHVTGAAALYKATHTGATPSQVKSALSALGSTKSTLCNNNNGHGYFQGDPDSESEPLLYVGTAENNYHYSPSLTLTGSNFRDVSSSSLLQLSRFSVASWFKTTMTLSSDAFLVNKGGLTSETAGRNLNYGIWINGGQVKAGFETVNGDNFWKTSPDSYNDGNWHYVVCTFDGSTVRLYIDGVKIGTKLAPGPPDNSGSQPVRVGADSQSPRSFFTGNVDEVRIWNRALSSQEVANAFTGTFNTSGQVLYLPFN